MRRIAVVLGPPTLTSVQVFHGINRYATKYPELEVYWFDHHGAHETTNMWEDISSWSPGALIYRSGVHLFQTAKKTESPSELAIEIHETQIAHCVTIDYGPILEFVQQQLEYLPQKRVVYFGCNLQTRIRDPLAERFKGDFLEYQLAANRSDLIALAPKPSATFKEWVTKHAPFVAVVNEAEEATYLQRVLHKCGIDVPNSVAIIALNDSYLCNANTHCVSAIEQPWEEVGYQAVRLAHRSIEGFIDEPQCVAVAAEVIHRRSSTIGQSVYPWIQSAVNYIDANLSNGISVSDILARQNVSRVTFERKFREIVGVSPGLYIRKNRLKLAMDYLASSQAPISVVAKKCGFSSPQKFSAFFKIASGESPQEFREKSHRNSEGDH